MYQIQKSNKGYQFTTTNNHTYSVYFTQLTHLSHFKFQTHNLSADNFYYFGIERMTKKKGGTTDIFVKRTIAYILFDFFTQYQDAVIVFNYSNDDKRILARRKVFKRWFDEYSIFSLFQFYQHDYSDEVSLCALYLRRGGLEFDKLKSDIQNFIANVGNEIGIEKNGS